MLQFVTFGLLKGEFVMFCRKCGKEVLDEAVVCPHCGCQISDTNKPQSNATAAERIETDGIAKGAFICAFLIPIVGLILGIIGCATYKNPDYKQKSTTAIIVSVVMWIIGMIFYGIIIGALTALELFYL